MIRTGLLAIALLLRLTGNAQQKETACRFRFAVAEQTRLDLRGVWPEDARKWWNEEGKKKFPELCEAGPHEADFVIAWLRTQNMETHWRPKSDFPAAPVYDCYQSPGETTCHEDANGRLNCYTGPSQTICTPQPLLPAMSEWESEVISVDRVSVTVFRVTKDHLERLAFVRKTGYYSTARPGKASFQGALKALKKKAGSRAR